MTEFKGICTPLSLILMKAVCRLEQLFLHKQLSIFCKTNLIRQATIKRRFKYMSHKLAFIGFGVVGQGLAEILLAKKEELKQKEGFEATVVAISDFIKGSIYHPNGLDIELALKTLRETGNLENY